MVGSREGGGALFGTQCKYDEIGTMETLDIVSQYYNYSTTSQLTHQIVAPFLLIRKILSRSITPYKCINTQTYSSLSDACYILSFAIIMLNTSLHNPNVKHKVRERERFMVLDTIIIITVKL